jgi:hypothetical protein
MRKRVHLALTVVLLALAGVAAWLGLREREPVYQGHRLSFWLEILMTPSHADDRVAQEAIRHIGTNALPVLIEKLQAQDTWLEQLMLTWAKNHKFIPFHFKSAYERRNEALCGYKALGPLASGQVPSLIDMLTHDPSPDVRYAAASALGCIGPGARLAVPALLHATKDTDGYVRRCAFWAFGQIRPDPELGVPVLVAGLADSDLHARLGAAYSLGEYGPAAKAAVPLLLRWLAKHGSEHDAAASALKAIDPAAAAKAGVK